LVVSEASAADLVALANLVNHAYRGASAREGWTHEADLLDGQRTDPDLLAEMIVPPSAIVVARDEEGAILACVHASMRRPGVGYLGMLAVDPILQGRGVGGALVEAVEARARAAGYGSIELTVLHMRASLIAWYERLGYRRTGDVEPFPYGEERYGQPRRDDLALVVMAKALAPPELS
jgi:ribosomal protein S18 acetylase RimI-like enzyme